MLPIFYIIKNIYIYNNFMKVININLDIDSFLDSKYEFENALIEEKIIDKHMPITEFINYIQFDKNIFVYNDQFIPFSIHSVGDEQYIFCHTDDKEKQNILLEELKKLDYNLNNLKVYSDEEILENTVYESRKYFIINGKIAK